MSFATSNKKINVKGGCIHMQRGQYGSDSKKYNLDQDYLNKMPKNEGRKEQAFHGTNLLERLMFHGGNIISVIFLISTLIDYIFAGEEGWKVIASFIFLVVHALILGLSNSAIKARMRSNKSEPVIRETLAWSILGLALGYIFAPAGIMQLILGLIFARVFYIIAKKHNYTARAVTISVMIIFYINVLGTFWDDIMTTLGMMTEGENRFDNIKEKLVYIYSYTPYIFLGKYYLPIVVFTLVAYGRKKDKSIASTNETQNKAPYKTQQESPVSSNQQEANTNERTETQEVKQSAKTQQTIKQNVKEQPKPQITPNENVSKAKEDDNIDYPSAGNFFQEGRRTLRSSVSSYVKNKTNIKQFIKDKIRKFGKF